MKRYRRKENAEPDGERNGLHATPGPA